MSRTDNSLASIAAQHQIKLPTVGSGQRVDQVQVDGLALLKILKHARESGLDNASGPLLGLVVDHVLEITNCFPFPNRNVGEENDSTGEMFQIEMLRCLREVNVDHLQVGWYTSTYLGTYISEALIGPQFNFQKEIEESIALVYDPVRTAQGAVSLRAFRLTQKFMDLYKNDTEFTSERVRTENLTYASIFEEVPVVVKSSSLARMLLNELDNEESIEDDFERLDLSTNSYLEKNLRQLMMSVEELSSEQQKLHMYQKDMARRKQQQQQYLHKQKMEAHAKELQGEKVEPEDLTNHPLFKPVPAPSRLESMLVEGQINHYCSQLSSYVSASTSKLFVAQGLQNEH